MSALAWFDAAGGRFLECAVTRGLDVLLLVPLVLPITLPGAGGWADVTRPLAWRSWIAASTPADVASSTHVGAASAADSAAGVEPSIARSPADQVEAITAAALHVAAAQGRSLQKDPLHRAGVALLLVKVPQWDEKAGCIDYDYWFHGTLAMKSLRDPRWHGWQEAVWQALLPNQRTRGHVGGSFDAAPDPWGNSGGRAYATAINALTLAHTIELDPTGSAPSGAR